MLEIYLARRFLKNMTILKASVLAEVTGMPVETILNAHRECIAYVNAPATSRTAPR